MKRISPFSVQNKGRSWFWWGIKFGAVLIFAIWWWLENQPDNSKKIRKAHKPIQHPDKVTDQQITIDHETVDMQRDEIMEPDDLRVIEGLGPKSQQALMNAGVITFSNLAGLSSEKIDEILKNAGVRISFPETWPEQAALAASGEWEKLTKFQDGLVGGRKVRKN